MPIATSISSTTRNENCVLLIPPTKYEPISLKQINEIIIIDASKAE